MPVTVTPTLPAAGPAKVLRLARRDLALDGHELGFLRETPAAGAAPQALRERMAEDGYLLMRGLIARERVEAARRVVLEHLDAQGQVDRSHPLMDGYRAEGAKGGYFGGRREVTHQPDFLNAVESPELADFWAAYFGEAPVTIEYKWLRAVAGGDATSPHYDVVYMGRGTRERLFTCWIPLGDLTFDDGPLALLAGSHRLPSYERIRQTYGNADADRDNIETFFSHDPREIVQRYGGQWQTSEFRMGDVLIFGMFTMHGAVANRGPRFRLSTDVRWQPASEPMDPRWIGAEPAGNYAWRKTPTEPLEVSRRKWGV
ncbi:MAG: phytanoyl-CoA dioxygenase family protein [Planctomycetes bacterium]|nr:phytanoyl-CoA dioxygenase family protein [Planctomycetota bacterium]